MDVILTTAREVVPGMLDRLRSASASLDA
jgi:hypothetical protein